MKSLFRRPSARGEGLEKEAHLASAKSQLFKAFDNAKRISVFLKKTRDATQRLSKKIAVSAEASSDFAQFLRDFSHPDKDECIGRTHPAIAT